MSSRHTQAGFSLVSAIFLLVVVSLAGAGMVSLSSVSRRSSSLALLELRAYAAARSGIEWGTAKAVATPATCPAASFALTEGGLIGFNVTVSCSMTTHVEGSVTTNVMVLSAQAQRGSFGDLDYVSRQLEATLSVVP
ncbi:MAG: pilus assembly protein MshP [Myxococcota bacterium]